MSFLASLLSKFRRPKRYDPLNPEAVVFRLVKRSVKAFYPDPLQDFPTSSAFQPSSDDKQEAQARNRTPAISTWTTSRTNVREACAIRGASPADFGVLYLTVADITAIQTTDGPLLAYADPLEPPDIGASLPGSDGHSAIEGHARASLKKGEKQALLEALLQKARRSEREPT